MVAKMAAIAREKVAGNITSTKFAIDIPSKLNNLRQLKLDFSRADSFSVSQLLPPLLDLHSDRFSPVRKSIAEIAGDVGLKYTGLLPEIVPVLITLLKDGTPAVARQAIKCGIDLFRRTLVEVAIKGLYSSELDDSLESAWGCVRKLKDEICSIAFQAENDGRRLLALKFVEVITLLYTTDPSGPSEPPVEHVSEGKFDEFNVSWLRGGHPVLNVGDLSVEASQNLALLLDQLRPPTVKSQSNLVIIVLISSLSTIAKKRPAFYGRILPVLLGLDPLSSASRGLEVSGVQYALRRAFNSCLKCTHPGAAPWRNRLAVALREMKVGDMTEKVHQDSHVNGSVKLKKEPSVIKDEKPSSEVRDAVPVSSGKKRSGPQDNDAIEDDDTPGKRARKTPNETDRSLQASSRDHDISSSSGATTSKENVDNGPVQQLVAMFGALVAQGEKAVGSLEILISSISADLLAEVVMANMRHLPPNRPKTEAEELLRRVGTHPDIIGSETHFKNLSSFLTGIFSPSGNIQKTDSLFNDASEDHEMQKPEEDEYPAATPIEIDVPCSSPSSTMDHALLPAGLPVSSSEAFPSVMDVGLTIPPEISDVGAHENEIPGLESSVRSDGWQEIPVASSLVSAELEDTSQEQVTSLGRSSLDVLPSISTDRSEELSPKTTFTEATSINSSSDTSSWLSSQVVLPKMSAPIISLADEQKDQIQNSAFMRIIEAYKQIAVSGGSQLRFSLLAYLGVEFPLELDPWKLLQKHILSDYVNHQGHELTLRVLFRLFGEAEADRDFFSSTTATSVYEMFLLTVAETLRDSFPAADKSLSKLLSEVPYLPKSVLKLLECLCSPGSSDKDEELHSGERVHQGLSIVWSLILLRPPIRDVCLKIVLQSAVHHLEEVRMKAIRLVANKLYPIPSISPQIEDFAKETLLSSMNDDLNIAKPGADGSNTAIEKDLETEKPSNEGPSSVSGMTKDASSESGQLSVSGSVSPTSVTDAKRCMSLYFALCTKKHLLFREVFVIYNNMSNAAKQAVHNEIPKLVRTIGSSSQLLEIISDPPAGSENLLTQVLQTLTDGTIPSPELVFTIKKLYDTKVKDADILIPVLPFLPKDEVLQIFPHFVKLQLDKFQLALGRMLTGSSQSGPVLNPAEVLIAIHVIDPDRDGIPLKKVTDACNTCFEQRQIFTQQVLAKVLNQLVEQIPLPLLFMRTVLQAIGAFPSLVEFIMEILSRLVSKQIWKYPKLWVGFLKCAQLTKPQSFSVLLQLPPAQLENALNRIAALKAPLVEHANQPNIRSSLPRSVLTVLGIATETQSASQGQQTAQSQTGDTGNSDKEVATEKPKESSSAS